MEERTIATMSKRKRSSRIGLTPLQEGQLWRVEDWDVQIKHVGKTLVHYRSLNGTSKHARVRMSAKDAVEEYLRKHSGILIRESGS
jgi:hypothetical protein